MRASLPASSLPASSLLVTSLLASSLVVVAAAPAVASPAVSPASVNFAELRPKDKLTLTLTVTNPDDKPARISCRGSGWKLAPAKLKLGAGESATVTATFTLPARPKTVGRMEAPLTCGDTRVLVSGTSTGARHPAIPTAAGELARAFAEHKVTWAGGLVSSKDQRTIVESCAAGCCAVTVRDGVGNREPLFVRADAGCADADALAPDVAAATLTQTLSEGGYVPSLSVVWSGEAVLLPGGKLLTWKAGVAYVDGAELAKVPRRPSTVELALGAPVALLWFRAGDDNQFVAVTLPE